MDKKLTDAEIKKALQKEIQDSKRINSSYALLNLNLLKETVDLINRQEAKLEAYQMDKEQTENDILNHQMNLEHSQAENESLKAEVERLKNAFENSQKATKYWHSKCGELVEEIQTAKAEAYKECIEKVKKELSLIRRECRNALDNDGVFAIDRARKKLNNLLKEMVGE